MSDPRTEPPSLQPITRGLGLQGLLNPEPLTGHWLVEEPGTWARSSVSWLPWLGSLEKTGGPPVCMLHPLSSSPCFPLPAWLPSD